MVCTGQTKHSVWCFAKTKQNYSDLSTFHIIVNDVNLPNISMGSCLTFAQTQPHLLGKSVHILLCNFANTQTKRWEYHLFYLGAVEGTIIFFQVILKWEQWCIEHPVVFRCAQHGLKTCCYWMGNTSPLPTHCLLHTPFLGTQSHHVQFEDWVQLLVQSFPIHKTTLCHPSASGMGSVRSFDPGWHEADGKTHWSWRELRQKSPTHCP